MAEGRFRARKNCAVGNHSICRKILTVDCDYTTMLIAGTVARK
jgi:hypothetical protein